ncbi:unnamed protein product [Schistosoma curassoni]|uniref:Uncharacterized protein n=1 Tax=Schistosoma curassoni TaxID=6186 RepID=A0A183KE05_9TREM|nr:unnamed protein product [Schistosoma curassoni]
MVFTSEFFDCHEFCEKSEHLNDGKVIFQSDTYKYVSHQSSSITNIQSHYYHYSQLIRRNQPSPIVGENFEKLVTDKLIECVVNPDDQCETACLRELLKSTDEISLNDEA